MRLLFSSISIFEFLISIAFAHASESISLQSFKTHSRLVIQIDESVEAQFKNSRNGFEIFLHGASFSDFGVPLGEEKKWMQTQGSVLQDVRLKSVQFEEMREGIKIWGKWKFPTGKLTLANPMMEYFEYSEKNPPQLIVDFWLKKGPTLIEANESKRRSDREALQKKYAEEAKKRAQRRIEQQKSQQETENLSKFCREPLSEKEDVFLVFFPAHNRLELKRWFSVVKPDKGYSYSQPQEDSSEAKYVRLAVKLYLEGNAALAIRVLDFFNSEHPHSLFKDEMKFLRANALLRLGHKKEARDMLREIASTGNTKSNAAFHAGVYVAADAYEQGASLAAFESFAELIQKFPEHPLAWVFHLAAGEALYELKQIDQAAKELQWVAMRAPDQKARASAAVRMGDLYLGRQDYERALASYFQAIRLFQDEIKSFPNVHINRAEVLYWLGQYERAEAEFKKFLEEYPTHLAGWRATFRLGEIFGRRQNLENQTESRKWYYETINRFPFSPGATLARMRLLPCGDHGGFDPEGVIRFFKKEAAEFNSRGEVLLRRYQDFRALAYVRTLVSLGQDEQAVDVAIEELDKTAPQSEARTFVSHILKTVFRKTVVAKLDQGETFNALKFYEDRIRNNNKLKDILHHSTNADYLLKLSLAASDLGLGKLADEFVTAYPVPTKSFGPSRFPAHAAAIQEAGAMQDLEHRLQSSEESFTKAKALWIREGFKAAEQIRPLLEEVVEESPFSYEKEIILGLIDEQNKQYPSALAHALKAELQTHKLREQGRLMYWIASLQGKGGDAKTAVRLYQKISKKDIQELNSVTVAGFLGVAPVPKISDLKMAEGDLLDGLGRWGEAAEAYFQAVQEGHDGNHAKYEYARSLLKTNQSHNRVKAYESLEEIVSGSTEDFWKKLAVETLANAEKQGVERKPAKEGKK